MKRTLALYVLPLVTALAGAACQGSESSRVVDTPSVETKGTYYAGPRTAISIGKFNNASPYMRGIFSAGQDRLGSQARTLLTPPLSETGRISGQVTEFGRKTTGDKQLFGILGRGKKQVAYSKVSMNIVDVRTSRVVYSVQGAGEFLLSDREVVGFGSESGYDSTLNGKVLNLSVTDAVNKLVRGIESGEWVPDVETGGGTES